MRVLGFRSAVGFALIAFTCSILVSCAPRTDYFKEENFLRAPCPKRISAVIEYCPTKHAYSSFLQHLSKVRIKSLKTGKSLTIAVKKSTRVRGICIPKKYRSFMGGKKSFKGIITTLRCGENGISRCPKWIRGYASWYGPKFHGRRTASGVRFNMHDHVAAHRSLPFGTVLLVKNLKNGKTVKVKILDRGPFVKGRHLDLSYGAAKRLGMLRDGVIPFIAEVIKCGS